MFNENNYYKKLIEIATDLREGSSTFEEILSNHKDFLNANRVGIKEFVYDISNYF